MKKEKMNVIEGIGRFIGASAWGFTHMPMLVAQELKKNKNKKTGKERALEEAYRIHKEYSEKLSRGELSKDEDDRLTKEFLEAIEKFQGYYNRQYETGL